jgi:hypothetical protein
LSPSELGHFAFASGAESGAVDAEIGLLTVEALAAALLALPAADRDRLAAMLTGQGPGQAEGKGGCRE